MGGRHYGGGRGREDLWRDAEGDDGGRRSRAGNDYGSGSEVTLYPDSLVNIE